MNRKYVDMFLWLKYIRYKSGFDVLANYKDKIRVSMLNSFKYYLRILVVQKDMYSRIAWYKLKCLLNVSSSNK